MSKSRHHILPKSKGGNNGNRFGGNIAVITEWEHNQLNGLFGSNATPVEIIEKLVKHFWGGQWGWVELALDENKPRRRKRRKK